MRRTVYQILAILFGSGCWAASTVGILIPHEFLAGGVSGLALILYYLFEWPPVGLSVFVLNVPLFVWGWRTVSREFFWLSLASMAGFSVLVSVLPAFEFRVRDPMLGVLLAGFISGIGSGVMYRAGGSGGGTEILGVILNRKWGFRVGALTFAANGAVLALGGVLLSLERALYTMVVVYVSATVMDRIIGGFNQRKSVMIISPQHEEIAAAILKDLNRGVTRIQAEGVYTRTARPVLYTVVALTELARLKEIVTDLDRNAFMTINSNLEVIGHGFQKPGALAPPIFGTGKEALADQVRATALW
jgi:uncharacterized membrane-anchored protein YitT (DUF2179 family)